MAHEPQSRQEWANSLRQFMLETVALMEAAKRRLWSARDAEALAKVTLQTAKAELAAAERDYSEQRALMEQNWDFFRSEYERVWSESQEEPPPADLAESMAAVAERVAIASEVASR